MSALLIVSIAGGWKIADGALAASRQSTEIVPTEVVFQVWDSKLYPGKFQRPIFWLDDSQILVAADKGRKPRNSAEASAQETWLYLWKIGENPRPLGMNPHQASVAYCAASGRVSYRQKTNAGLEIRLVGIPGLEQEKMPQKRPAAGVPGNIAYAIEPLDCEIYFDAAMSGQSYVTTSDRRYYLVFGKSGPFPKGAPENLEQLVLMSADGADRTTLPISRGEVSALPEYRSFDKAFLVYKAVLLHDDDFSLWHDKNCWPVWRVEPESKKTERFCIPHGEWVGSISAGPGASLSLLPTRAGYFFAYRRNNVTSGFYQIRGQSVRKIFGGYIESPVVSPNGCRIAFGYVPDDEAFKLSSPLSSTISVIDLCG